MNMIIIIAYIPFLMTTNKKKSPEFPAAAGLNIPYNSLLRDNVFFTTPQAEKIIIDHGSCLMSIVVSE